LSPSLYSADTGLTQGDMQKIKRLHEKYRRAWLAGDAKRCSFRFCRSTYAVTTSRRSTARRSRSVRQVMESSPLTSLIRSRMLIRPSSLNEMKYINRVGSLDLCGFDFLRIDGGVLVWRDLISLYQFVRPDFLAGRFGLEDLANG